MAAATDQQISLAIAQRGSSSHLNKHARQIVPAFLQKLYEMVNDPANQDLIRWSDTGDSFFVLDQERFASEVLGRWFKHNRFSTFVRQLNMYGFHKIPHLQQGVLRSDSDTEFWNYEHPHFLRGQPDLLCLIQRKKPAAGDDAHVAPAAAVKTAAGGGAVGALSANQLLDISSIVHGIQAIKRHQAAISADLNELKSSNQHLWQEAMVTRERHKKHQDTINRILKFLAGVFGHGDNQMGKDEDTSHTVVARKPQRLLIADGRSEVAEEESRSSMESARSTGFLASLDTPSTQPSELLATRFASVEPSVADAPSPITTEPRRVPQEHQPVPIATPSNTANATSLAAPTATSTPPQASNDHIVQTALTSVLNSPAQTQKLLAALAAQSFSEAFSSVAQPHHPQQAIASSSYNSSSQHFAPSINSASGNVRPSGHTSLRLPSTFDYAAAGALSPLTLPILGGPSDPDQFALQQQEDQLQKTHKSTAEINNDVDELQSNIQSLIQNLGIDPTTLDSVLPHTETGAGVDGWESASALPPPSGDLDMFPSANLGNGQDFDFDSFLMDMQRTNEEDGELDKLAERLDPSTVSDPSKIGSASSEQLHAFLDEVASQDGGGMNVPQLHETQAFRTPSGAANDVPGVVSGVGTSVEGGTRTRGRKRKSDAIPDRAPMLTTGTKSLTTGSKSRRER